MFALLLFMEKCMENIKFYEIQAAYVDFASVRDTKYRSLLLAEYRFVKSIQDKIRKNAAALYKHKLVNGDSTPLAKRCLGH